MQKKLLSIYIYSGKQDGKKKSTQRTQGTVSYRSPYCKGQAITCVSLTLSLLSTLYFPK